MKFKFSAIVFDLGQVLVPFDYSRFVNKIESIKPGLGERFLELYKNNYNIHREFESGKISEQLFITKMLEFLEHKIDGETFCRYWSDIFSLNNDVVKLLPQLKQNYKIYLLSNTNSIHKKYGFGHYDFLKLFDKVFLSHEVGFIKPQPEIYKAVEKVSGLYPSEHFFIDDILEYVEGAKSVGWDGIQFLGYYDLIHQLKLKGIVN